MQVYLVGGAVRDEVMGVEPKDKDYVVVGSTPEELLSAGYRQVGGDFPVFLHPITGDEYALARTEFKEGHGYQGFSVSFGPEVTLEDDLSRRDLTINAMAKDIQTGEIIDPFGGQKDIESKTLRHTTEAFADDPVRVLRVARFLARYPDFQISVDLFNLIEKLSCSGELEHLKAERVWLETWKTLSEATKPSRYFRFLVDHKLFPELAAMLGVQERNRWHPEEDVFEHTMLALDYCKVEDSWWQWVPEVRFGVLCHDFGKPAAYAATEGKKSTMHEKLGVDIVDAFCDRLKVPNDFRRYGKLCAEYHTHCHLAFDMKPKTIHKLMKNFRNFGEFSLLLKVATCDKRGRGKPACDWVYTQPRYLINCYLAMSDTDTKSISSSMEPGPAVGEAIRLAEIAAIASVDKEPFQTPYDECHVEYFKSLENK